MTNKPDIKLSTGKTITHVRTAPDALRVEVVGGGDMTDAEWSEYAERAARGITARLECVLNETAWVASIQQHGKQIKVWTGGPGPRGKAKVERLARKWLKEHGCAYVGFETGRAPAVVDGAE